MERTSSPFSLPSITGSSSTFFAGCRIKKTWNSYQHNLLSAGIDLGSYGLPVHHSNPLTTAADISDVKVLFLGGRSRSKN